jgi:hypothetical protein
VPGRQRTGFVEGQSPGRQAGYGYAGAGWLLSALRSQVLLGLVVLTESAERAWICWLP